MDPEDHHDSPQLHFLAGAFAGILSDFVVHPIDTLRARLQAQREAKYKGATDVFVKTIKGEGVKALYKGFGIVALATTPAHALYFTAYEGFKRRLQTDKVGHEKSSWVYFVSGFFADCVGLSIWLPMDLVKQRLQVQQNNMAIKYRNSAHAFYTIARDEGVRGLYRGGLIAAFTMYGAVYFPLYENYKIYWSRYRGLPSEQLTLGDQLLGGFLAGGLAAAVTCPCDVVKTQMQVYSIADGGEKTVRATAKSMYRQHGWKVFVAGLGPRILWIGGGTAITMGAYEQCKNFIVWFGKNIFGKNLE